MLDVHGSLQLLNSTHVRERDKALLRSVMVGGVWNGFLLGRVRGPPVPCRFCGSPDGDGHLFGECTFPPLVEIRENPEFHDLMRENKAHWPRCLLWHGWLPMLSGVNGASSWAAAASESALSVVEVTLGLYSSGLVSEWSLRDGFWLQMRFLLWFWIRSLVFLLQVLVCLLTSLNVAGVIAGGAMLIMFSWIACLVLAVGFVSVPVPLQTVQRAELWEGDSCSAVI